MPHFPIHRSGIGNQSTGLVSSRRRFAFLLENSGVDFSPGPGGNRNPAAGQYARIKICLYCVVLGALICYSKRQPEWFDRFRKSAPEPIFSCNFAFRRIALDWSTR
ncbi:predicted protein [Brucella sp. 83/13]|nr:predicted protein [Brucella sp. 83/13]